LAQHLATERTSTADGTKNPRNRQSLYASVEDAVRSQAITVCSDNYRKKGAGAVKPRHHRIMKEALAEINYPNSKQPEVDKDAET